MTSQDWLTKDFYKTLGVTKDADDATIKKAYRKLARDLHPDRNPDNAEAERKFKEVGEAYGVLSDAQQRQQYDAVRAMGAGGPRFSAGGAGGPGFEDAFGGAFGGGYGGGGFGRGGAYASTGSGGPGFEDILSNLFGGGVPRGPQKGSDVAAAAEVTFRQAASGATVTLGLSTGKISARLPVGVKDGQKIRLRGKGRPGTNGGEAGDLILTVHVAKHPVFSLEGLDITAQVPVSLAEAALGAVVAVPTIDGGSVRVKVPAGTQSGTRLRVKGRGLVDKGKAGDMYAAITVAVPKKLSKEAKAKLEEFAEVTSEDPRADLESKAAQ